MSGIDGRKRRRTLDCGFRSTDIPCAVGGQKERDRSTRGSDRVPECLCCLFSGLFGGFGDPDPAVVCLDESFNVGSQRRLVPDT
jgi:hypothetical protein